jgi:hypothetical protein
MEWWEILLAMVFTVPWLFLLVKELIIDTIIDSRKYKEKYNQWNIDNPDLVRIKCKDCKYCRSRTNYIGRYPNGIPERIPEYCICLKRNIKSNSSCLMAEPIPECYQKREKAHIVPSSNAVVYFSSYGNCYHSSPQCSSIRNAQKIYRSSIGTLGRRYCPKCWEEKEGILYPKK